MKTSKSVIKVKPCKKVVTFDPKTKKSNGWLLEILGDSDDFSKYSEHLKGQMYLTVADPGEFKGYHLHAGADYFVTCLKGKVKEIIYKNAKEKEEIKMGDGDFKTVFFPRGYPHAIQNIGKEPAYILVYRYPAWSPSFKEQLDIPRSKIKSPEAWKNIKAFIREFNKRNPKSRSR